MFLKPGITEGVLRLADGNDLAPEAKHGRVFENAEFRQDLSAARAKSFGGLAQG